jgi:hypothetical protein
MAVMDAPVVKFFGGWNPIVELAFIALRMKFFVKVGPPEK